jgi:predicted metal-binding membrane protein
VTPAGVAALREAGRSRFSPLIVLSVSGWITLAIFDTGLLPPTICAGSSDMFSTLGNSVRAAWEFGALGGLVLSWSAMLAAMMPPLLLWPLEHVWARSLTQRRPRAVALFAIGYAGVWLVATALLALASSALHMATGRGTASAFLIGLGAALSWQGSATKRGLLNRCHALHPLPVFGIAAEWGSISFGARTALTCVGACWALMLLPFLAGRAHLAVMAAVALFMLHERYATPRPARSNLPFLASGALLIVAAGATP